MQFERIPPYQNNSWKKSWSSAGKKLEKCRKEAREVQERSWSIVLASQKQCLDEVIYDVL